MSSALDRIITHIAAEVMEINPEAKLRDRFATVCKVLREVQVGVARKFNQDHPDILSRLPIELHARCFEELEVHDCLVVSHVSSRWRAVATGDPRFWTVIDFERFNSLYEGSHIKEDFRCRRLLSLCLARAGALPLKVLNVDAAPGIEKLVWDNMGRLSHVTGGSKFGYGLLLTRAPHLVHLECGDISFPDGFDASFVPNLKVLNAHLLHIPKTFYRIPTLVKLNISAGFFDRIFDHFPNLQELRVGLVLAPELLPLELPRSLRILELHNQFDLSHHISQWTGKHALRKLELFVLDMGAILDFFFAAVGDGDFGIEITDRTALQFVPRREESCKISITCESDFVSDPAIQRVYDRMVSLDISCCDDFDLSSLSAVEYPALTDLILGNCEDRVDPIGQKKPPLFVPELHELGLAIKAPLLRRITFRCHHLPEMDEGASLLTILDVRHTVDFTAERLQCFTIETPDSTVFSAYDWIPLFEFADEIFYVHPNDQMKDSQGQNAVGHSL